MQMVLVAVLAVTVEALVEYGKSIVCLLVNGGWTTALIQLAATVVAVVLCVVAGADMFALLGMPIGVIGGRLLTGIFVARGSNYVADFVKKVTATKTV